MPYFWGGILNPDSVGCLANRQSNESLPKTTDESRRVESKAEWQRHSVRDKLSPKTESVALRKRRRRRRRAFAASLAKFFFEFLQFGDHVIECRRRDGRLVFLAEDRGQLVERFHKEEKDHRGGDHEIDNRHEEGAQMQVLEIQYADSFAGQECSDDWRDEGVCGRLDQDSERRADDDRHRQLDHVPSHDKRLELNE